MFKDAQSVSARGAASGIMRMKAKTALPGHHPRPVGLEIRRGERSRIRPAADHAHGAALFAHAWQAATLGTWAGRMVDKRSQMFDLLL
jgi:hypothetical protein